MKKTVTVIIFVTIIAFCLLSLSKKSTLTDVDSFVSFYKKLPAKNFKFNLYDLSSSPISPETIKTLDGSYLDLIEFGKDSKYKIKISQIKHEQAMSQLKDFYIDVKNMKLCKASLEKELYELCSKNPAKGIKLYDYLMEQVYSNAKAPYKDAKEYFYLNFKTILNEDLRE